jgi:hypothetical protein
MIKLRSIPDRFFDYAAVSFIFLVFAYCCIRAFSVSIYVDEAQTYMVHSKLLFFQIITYNSPTWSELANNHLLNTLLVKMFVSLFGVSEFVIRIPALMGTAFYLFGIFKILKLFLRRFYLLLSVALLTMNPFMVDYFSMARGYSLGLGFMSFALFFLFKRLKEPGSKNAKNLFWSSTMMSFSVISNFTFLTVFVSVVCVYLFLEFGELFDLARKGAKKVIIFKKFLSGFLLPLAPGILFLLATCTVPIIKMMGAHAFRTGGLRGFFKDTVASLIEVSLYDKSYDATSLIIVSKTIIVILFFSAILFLLYKLIKKRRFELIDNYLFLIVMLISVSVATILLQHIFLCTKYVVNRAAIYFLPLFFMFFIIFWKDLAEVKNKFFKISNLSFFMFLCFVLLAHYFSCVNFDHFMWRYDASTRDVLDYIEKVNVNDNKSLTIGTDLFFLQSTNFYKEKNKMDWLDVSQKGPDGEFDYYYIYCNDTGILKKYDLDKIKAYNLSGACLAVPKDK